MDSGHIKSVYSQGEKIIVQLIFFIFLLETEISGISHSLTQPKNK